MEKAGLIMKEFEIIRKQKQAGKSPKVIIQGLPGIGNVGKLAADFLIKETKAEELAEIQSFLFPNTVFVNQSGLVNPASIKLYLKSTKPQDIIFISGNVQPSTDEGCYIISSKMTDFLKSLNAKTIITLGGVGVPSEPKLPKTYCAANSPEILSDFKREFKLKDAYGSVGPISGLAGLMLFEASRHGIPAICLVSETLSHPFFVGVDAARELVKILTKMYDLGITGKAFDKVFPKNKPAKTQEMPVHPSQDYIG
jgi:hypothetical protein